MYGRDGRCLPAPAGAPLRLLGYWQTLLVLNWPMPGRAFDGASRLGQTLIAGC